MIEELDTYESLCDMREDWHNLWLRCPGATPFQSPEWLLAWWRHLFQGGTMWTVAARSAGRLTGLAPLFIHGMPDEPRQVSFIGSGVSDLSGILAESVEAAQEICSHIVASRAKWDICDFSEIRAGEPMLSASFAPIEIERSVANVCPVVELRGTMQEFEGRLSPKFRHNLRNSRNRLRELGAEFVTSDAQQDGEFLEALFGLHAARWTPRGEQGVLGAPCVQNFLRDAAHGFRERGWMRLHGLRVNNVLQAVVCNFAARGWTGAYICGFDPALSRYSPGSVLFGFAIEHAISAGDREFDFLRQGEKYKYAWRAVDRLNARLVIRARKSESSALRR